MTRKALGRGLSSLIPQAPVRKRAVELETDRPIAGGVQSIDLDQIRPNREQPRKSFDEAALEELAASMRRDGVIQPVVVRPAGDRQYELIVGERRWRAAQKAGLLKIPSIVRDVSDDRLLELALVENLQREELNPIETALAFQSLVDHLGLTQQEVADRVGKERPTVANLLRLLNLPTAVQDGVRSGQLTLGHAKALAALGSPRLQTELAEKIARERLSVRQAEALVNRARTEPTTRGSRKAAERDPNVVAAETGLQRALATKVRIVQSATGQGWIELHFHSDDELERIYQVVAKAAQHGA